MSKIFAISDLHLPGGGEKPMEVFGEHWRGHFAILSEDWRARVSEGDLVLLPGDLSWAMRLESALPDLRAIGELPGRKLILKGNHDYWWGSIARLREALPEGVFALQNDAYDDPLALIAGTRGWVPAGLADCRVFEPSSGCVAKPLASDGVQWQDDLKIHKRELLRLEASLSRARAISQEKFLIAMTHFPPRTDSCASTEYTELFERYRVGLAVYGHLHGDGLRAAFRGVFGGVRYEPVSCDGLGFRLLELPIPK